MAHLEDEGGLLAVAVDGANPRATLHRIPDPDINLAKVSIEGEVASPVVNKHQAPIVSVDPREGNTPRMNDTNRSPRRSNQLQGRTTRTTAGTEFHTARKRKQQTPTSSLEGGFRERRTNGEGGTVNRGVVRGAPRRKESSLKGTATLLRLLDKSLGLTKSVALSSHNRTTGSDNLTLGT